MPTAPLALWIWWVANNETSRQKGERAFLRRLIGQAVLGPLGFLAPSGMNGNARHFSTTHLHVLHKAPKTAKKYFTPIL